MSSGVDEVLDAVPPNATLCNGRDLGHEEGTADLAATLVLASLRRIPEFVRNQSQRSWQHVRTHSLRGKRVLLVGYGAIGAAIEQRLSPFGVQVGRVSRTEKDGVSALSELPALAAAADVLLVCIALSPDTRGLVDASVLGRAAGRSAGGQRRARARSSTRPRCEPSCSPVGCGRRSTWPTWSRCRPTARSGACRTY